MNGSLTNTLILHLWRDTTEQIEIEKKGKLLHGGFEKVYKSSLTQIRIANNNRYTYRYYINTFIYPIRSIRAYILYGMKRYDDEGHINHQR